MNEIELLEIAGVGLIAGTWGALIGAGGGFIIVPLLLLLEEDMTAAGVTAVSLVAVCANGMSGTGAYARMRRIDYRSGILFMMSTLPGSVMGAILINHIGKTLFQVVFGGLLVLVAAYVFAKPRPKARYGTTSTGIPRRIVDSRGAVYEYSVNFKLGMCIAFLVGFMASTLGVGGGIFNVPAFVFVLGMPIQVATATSQLMVMGTSMVANITNIVQGDLWGKWSITMTLTVGSVVGAQLGARLSQRISSLLIARILATGLLVVGLRLVYGGITSF